MYVLLEEANATPTVPRLWLLYIYIHTTNYDMIIDHVHYMRNHYEANNKWSTWITANHDSEPISKHASNGSHLNHCTTACETNYCLLDLPMTCLVLPKLRLRACSKQQHNRRRNIVWCKLQVYKYIVHLICVDSCIKGKSDFLSFLAGVGGFVNHKVLYISVNSFGYED